jgi:hypothetical protein
MMALSSITLFLVSTIRELVHLAGLNDKGRTCTHEVGHYLGLRHIWGDGDCTVDDGIADTPDADDSSQAEDPSITVAKVCLPKIHVAK